MKGNPWHIFPTAFSSCPSALSRDSSPAKTNETQALMSHCKNSLRDKAIEVDLLGFERSHSSGCEPLPRARAGAMELGLARFCEGMEFIC